MTEHSYKANELLRMELTVLVALKYETYRVEPMIFVNRYVAAAQSVGDDSFGNAVLFFLDGQLAAADFSSERPSRLAAAAVLAVRAALSSPDERYQRCSKARNYISPSCSMWTASLRHYSGLALSELASLALRMLETGVNILRVVEMTPDKAYEPHRGIVRKFCSRSRHNQLLKTSSE